MDPTTQRHRFMAFAFASADLCLEIDEAGRVAYAAGAASSLGAGDAREFVGQRAEELFDAHARPVLTRLLKRLEPGRRAGPINARAGSRRWSDSAGISAC